jgi:heme a synthase
MSERRFSWFSRVVFGTGLLTILWGYFLRISESGDGCGTDWPLCHGALVPTEHPFSTWVEFTHRVTSGWVLILVLVLAFWARRVYREGHLVRRAALAALLLTVSESLFGALLVVLGWVATDVSLGRILIRPFHVTNTFLLLGALALVPWWAHTRPRGSVPGTAPGPATSARERLRPILPALVGAMALAWTGAWTGLAATAFPARTLQEGLEQYQAPEHVLIPLRVLHPLLALGVVVLLLRLARQLWDANPGNRGDSEAKASSLRIRRLAAGVGVLGPLQLAMGALTLAIGNPPMARLAHLFLADLLWLSLVWLAAELWAGHSRTKEVEGVSERTNAARS